MQVVQSTHISTCDFVNVQALLLQILADSFTWLIAGPVIAAVLDAPAVSPADALGSHAAALKLFQDNSVFTLGQNNVYPGAVICNGPEPAAIKANEREACQSPTIVPVDTTTSA
jgi:hypothetical protein